MKKYTISFYYVDTQTCLYLKVFFEIVKDPDMACVVSIFEGQHFNKTRAMFGVRKNMNPSIYEEE